MPARITVLGSINLDFSLQIPRMPDKGENVVAESFELIPGGKGANQAVAAARLGAEVTLIGCLGADSYGRVLRKRLSHEGVNVKFVSTSETASTGTAFVLVGQAEADNRIVSLLGANAECTPDHIEQAHRAFERCDFFLTSLGVPEETVNRALQVAADCMVAPLLDPSPLPKKPPQLWTSAQLITPNQTEAARLSGLPVTDIPTALAAAQKLAHRGLARIVITLGKRGCLLYDERHGRVIPSFSVPAVDPTGSGDAFAAALAVRLAEGATFEEAATFANAAGALTCGVRGAQPSLPDREAVEALLKRTRRDKKLKVEEL
ncbi:MAG TPA: ribokinase [Armatimonadota bacterium]|jgi:ribokinase